MYGICMCINITNIFMSLYKCVYFHLFENIIFNLNLFQRLHQQLSRCCCSERSTKLAATADLLIPSEKITLAGIFAISAQNPGVGLETMIAF